jgi:hypothetical protein
MKLGVSYIVFNGEELLEYSIRAIRDQVDFLSVVYQEISFFGNKASPTLLPTLDRLKVSGLIDELVLFHPDLKVRSKVNELNMRNIGLDRSIANGCTHHITLDTDEFIKSDMLKLAKDAMDGETYDCSMVENIVYFKEPTWQVNPGQRHHVSFINPVWNRYSMVYHFPYKIEITRRVTSFDRVKVFLKDEIVIHHMSYVRRDIRQKLDNSPTGTLYDIDEFVDKFNKYKLGERLCIAPDFLNRRTIEVDNIFNIPKESYGGINNDGAGSRSIE